MTAVRLVIEDTGFGLRGGVVEDGRLVEVREVDADEASVTDALFVARVARVEPKLNAAFLDCGLDEAGLLTAKDARAVRRAHGRPPIRELVHEGQVLLVQGVREGVEDKGPRFTTDIRLFGFALVHRPYDLGLDVGRPRDRAGEAARERASRLFPEGGFSLRRHALALEDDVLLAERESLAARWQELQRAPGPASKPRRLPAVEGTLARLLRGSLELGPTRLALADRALAAELRRLREASPALPPFEIELLPPGEPAFEAAGIAADLERAVEVDVAVPGGGTLRIEPTAALVAVDVDGGGRAPLEANRAAAGELALQLRLRNLGGTIVVDFIDLPLRPERQRLEETLRKAFRRDPAPVQVYPMSGLGLVQLSRARRGRALADVLERACPGCAGSGRVTSLRHAAEHLIAALRRTEGLPRRLRAAPDLARYLELDGGPALRRVAILRAPGLAVEADPALAPGAFALS